MTKDKKMLQNKRAQQAVANRLMPQLKEETDQKKGKVSENKGDTAQPTPKVEELSKKQLVQLIKDQGTKGRKPNSMRFNPIIDNALVYWTQMAEPDKSKADIVEIALMDYIPEEYLIEGYKLAKHKKQI